MEAGRFGGRMGRHAGAAEIQEECILDAIVDKVYRFDSKEHPFARPSREEAEEAVRTLIRWAGDDPSREGLVDTPARVIRAYEEFFSGYEENPGEILQRTFEEIGNYDDIVLLRDIALESHCEHHMVPVVGKAHIAYKPKQRAVGLSKLARVVEVFARRLQTQETMTTQIADTIDEALAPEGVAVMIEAEHQCMSLRGVHKPDVVTVTSKFTGVFLQDALLRERFLRMIRP